MQNLNLKDNWTVSFIWRPESSSREVYGELPIALIKILDGEYMALSYEAVFSGETRTGGKFILTDGTESIEITDNNGWKFLDTLKFAVSHTLSGTTLCLETPIEGILEDDNASLSLENSVHFVQFSTNELGQVKGIGSYGDCRMWESALSSTDVQKVFDLDNSAPDADIVWDADNMIFEREGDAYINKNYLGTGISVENQEGVRSRKALSASLSELTLFNSNDKIALAVYENQILLQNDPADEKLFSTEDGSTFTELIDFGDHPEFPDPTPTNTRVNSVGITDDGSWLVSVGVGVDEPSQIYRKAPGLDPTVMANWDMVLSVNIGYVANFGWTAMRDDEIAFTVYGSKRDDEDPDATPPTAVYYSPDSGATWGKIFELDENNYANWFNHGAGKGGYGLHGHCLTFHPATTDTLFISYGDGISRGIMRIDYTGGDKKDSNNWQSHQDNPIYNSEPTTTVCYKGYVYWGLDATTAEASVFRMNPDTHEFQSVNTVGHPKWNESSDLYYLHYNRAWVFSMAVVDGLLYAACFDQSDQDYGGLYVTSDGENWTCVNNIIDHDGLRFLAGITDDGYLWGWYRETSGTEKLFRMTRVNTRLIETALAERGATNQNEFGPYHDPSVWSITGFTNIKDSGDNTLDPILSQADEESLYGSDSLKVEFPEGIVSGERVVIRTYTLNNDNLDDGDLILISGYYKAKEGSSDLIQPIINIQYSTDGNGDIVEVEDIYGARGKTSAEKGWHRLDFWARASVPDPGGGDAVTGVRMQFRIEVEDAITAGHDLTDSVFYVDGLSCVIMPKDEVFLRTSYIPPDAAREPEYLIAPAFEIQAARSIPYRSRY